jgi:hypothetical protein
MSNSRRSADSTCAPDGLRWRGRRILPLLFAVSLLLAHCMPLSNELDRVPNRPVTRSFDVKEEVLRKAVERVLVRKNYVLDPGQSTAHHIRTKWVQDGSYRSMAVADLRSLKRSESELTLRVLFEKKGFMSETWNPLDEIGVDTYDMLMNDVSMETYRVLYEGG